MKKLALLFALLFSFLSYGQSSPDASKVAEFVRNTVYPATYLLYSEDDSGTMDMHCTATAIAKRREAQNWVVRFVTAGHCIKKRKEKADFISSIEPLEYSLTREDEENKVFFHATLIGQGDMTYGQDFSVWEIRTKRDIPIVPLGIDPDNPFDQPLISVMDPLGLGKQVFEGRVSRLKLERHGGPDLADWYGDMLIQLFGIDPGASGSEVICTHQMAICGFVIGEIAKSSVAVPVSRFNAWYKTIPGGSEDTSRDLFKELQAIQNALVVQPTVPTKKKKH